MDKKERLETLKKLSDLILKINEQKVNKQENVSNDKNNTKKLMLTNKDGFANMSLIIELILGISLGLGTMFLINNLVSVFL